MTRRMKGRLRAGALAAALGAAWVLCLPATCGPGRVAAGCYGYRGSYSAPSYSYGGYYSSYPTYYQPADYYPSYYEPQHRVEYVKEYVDREVLYPYPVKAYVNPDYYFSSQDFYREKLLVDAVAGRVAQMMQGGHAGGVGAAVGYGAGFGGQAVYQSGQSGYAVQPGAQVVSPELLQALVLALKQQGLGQPGGAEGGAGPGGPGAGGGGNGGGAQGGGGGGPPAEVPKFQYLASPLGDVNPRLAAVVRDNCLSCHGGKDPKRLNLGDLSRITVADRYLTLGLVYHKDSQVRMPKNGSALKADELELFQEWADRAYSTSRSRR